MTAPIPTPNPLPRIGIISLGDMGSGLASLLTAHSYPVLTNLAGRSAHTAARAEKAGVTTVSRDEELVLSADIIFSIVPPRDAVATAARVRAAFDKSGAATARQSKLWYADLNAIAPATARAVGHALGIRGPVLETLYFRTTNTAAPAPASAEPERIVEHEEAEIILLDGGIIGGPPMLDSKSGSWSKPSIPTSGPYSLCDIPHHGAALSTLLNSRHIAAHVGAASGLKMCFASLSKGFAALACQSYASAYAMGVLPELQRELADRVPAVHARAEAMVPSLPPKAYRWVGEMREIGRCFGVDGGVG